MSTECAGSGTAQLGMGCAGLSTEPGSGECPIPSHLPASGGTASLNKGLQCAAEVSKGKGDLHSHPGHSENGKITRGGV